MQVDDDRVGRSSSASSIAARPSSAVPTTASWGCRSISGESASRNALVVVGEENANRASAHRPPAWVRKLALFDMSLQPLRRRVSVIGAALDLGQGRRGVDMGPSAIRYAGLDARLDELGHEYVDCGNVETAVAEATAAGDEQARFLPQIKDTSRRIATLVARAAREGSRARSCSAGTTRWRSARSAGLAEVHGPGGTIWIDAHGDLNSPETSPSGNVHGMVLAAALGLAGTVSARTVGVCPRSSPAALLSSGSARSTTASARCSASSTRRCSR